MFGLEIFKEVYGSTDACAINGEDFYRMGDLGAIMKKNDEKYMIFLGRTGDWIRFKGENWAPVDGERIVIYYEEITNAGIRGDGKFY